MNFGELFKRAIKYIVEGIVVALAAVAIPKQRLNAEEIVLVALIAAMTFAILDTFIPSMGASTRQGAGFAIGTGLTGGIKMM
jgi:ABC-type Co2+ transport system permease subunit